MSQVPFENLPPHVQAYISDVALRYQTASAEQDDFVHSVMRLFSELDNDQLKTLESMLHQLSHRGNRRVASHWHGMVAALRSERFGVCPVHGVNHIEEMQKSLDEEPAGDEHGTDPDLLAGNRMPTETEVEAANKLTEALGPIITPDMFDEATRALMAKYHIDDLYDEDTKMFIGFKCTGIEGMVGDGCGMTYPSIEDRMLRDPETCSGCHIKSAHG